LVPIKLNRQDRRYAAAPQALTNDDDLSSNGPISPHALHASGDCRGRKMEPTAELLSG
jgi:hypothetical protein